MSLVVLLLGVVLVLFGRTLYWVFVAVVGFLVGFELAAIFLAGQPDWVRLLVALVGGVLGALLGMLAARAVFSIGGLFAGGYLGLMLAREAGVPGDPLIWLAVGGILGAIVAALIMDWAIIALSSLAGSAAIVGQLDLQPTAAMLLFIFIAAIGIVVQSRRLVRPAAMKHQSPPAT